MGHAINLDEYKLLGTHWIALYVNGFVREEHLTMQYILIALELNIFQKKLKHF